MRTETVAALVALGLVATALAAPAASAHEGTTVECTGHAHDVPGLPAAFLHPHCDVDPNPHCHQHVHEIVEDTVALVHCHFEP